MSASHQEGRNARAADGGRGAPGAATTPPGSLAELVGSSDVPLAAVDLPSGRFLAVNTPLATVLGSSVSELTSSSSLDWLSPDNRDAAKLGLHALADGDLTGYQAIRRLANPQDPDQVFSVWISSVDFAGTRVGLVSVVTSAGRDARFRALPPVSSIPEPGNVVLGTVDSSWRVDRICQDVTWLLGITPEQVAGRPVLGAIHPADVPAFLASVEHARRGERAVRLSLRLSARQSDWTEVTVVLATLSPGSPPPLAFALIRDDAAANAAANAALDGGGMAGPGEDSTREMQLETHMLRIADELRAAGLIPRLQQLPPLSDTPDLGKLTSREWAVLTRLLDGQRVSAIAADLFVSQSTVRNHLSSIYAKLGVHSQVDLVRLIRREARRPADGR